MRLYKYRGNIDIKNKSALKLFERDVNMISNNEIWCSTIENLNDPFEGEFNIDKFTQNLDSITSFLSFFRIKKKSETNNKNYISAIKKTFDLTLKSGIYSLSADYNNELMWSHYANSHLGYCIEYEFENLKEFELKFKEYYNPKLNVFDKLSYSQKPFELNNVINNREDIIKYLFKKSKIWEYENEYRIVTFTSGKFNYNVECLKSIIFGLKAKEEIINIVIEKLKHLNIDFYKMERIGPYKIEKKYLC